MSFLSFAKNLKWKIKVAAYNENIRLIEAMLKPLRSEYYSMRLLDIGCNDGYYTKRYCDILRVGDGQAYGIDYNEANIKGLPAGRFIAMDIDNFVPFPFQDKMFDVVVMNQVLEHTKNISHIIHEINRVLKADGVLVISVPNLAAWHNRLMLLFGRMPAAIQGMNAHVRGFTSKSLSDYVAEYGFKCGTLKGSGVYPFWGVVSQILSLVARPYAVFITAAFRKIADHNGEKVVYKEFHDTKL